MYVVQSAVDTRSNLAASQHEFHKKNVSKIIGLFLTKKLFVPKIKGLFLLGFVPKI